ECGRADRPGTWLRHLVLELPTHSELGDRALPPLAAGAPLIAEAAKVVALLPTEVAVTGDVEAGGPATVVVLVLEAVDGARRTAAEVVVHQVVAQLAGAGAQAVRPDVPRRAHQDPRGVQRRCAEEDHARLHLRVLLAHRIDEAYARHPLSVGVVDQLRHDREGTEGEVAGPDGCRSEE